ncbi:MAG: hypothetical protein R3B70_14155 [Polyangiaceae bacterium]
MVKVRRSPDGPLLVDALRDVLSPQALDRLARLNVRRDPAQTCSEAELRAGLEARGLPVYERVLDFEKRCGGTVWPTSTFGTLDRLGTWAALREREGPVSGGRQELSIDYDGRTLVPISADHHASSLWMDQEGTIYLCDDCDWAPTASSAATLLEREALKWGYPEQPHLFLRWRGLPTMTEEDFRLFEHEAAMDLDGAVNPPYDEEPEATFDCELARALALPVFEAATDPWRRVWFDGVRLLFPHHVWRDEERLLRAGDVEQLLRMLLVAHEVRPSAPAMWRAPCDGPPGPGETVLARVPAYQNRHEDITGEILVIQSPSSLRAHIVTYDTPIAESRAWHARRQAWAATLATGDGGASS